MVRARKYVVRKYFDGLPKRSDFEIVEQELPPLQDGELLIKTEWISVDPYLRAYNSRYKVPYDQFSIQVGIVEETKDSRYPVGTRIVSHNGWCDYSIAKVEVPDKARRIFAYPLPDLRGLSPSLGVGAVGMPGVTAYFGFLEICKPKAGETVVVTGAAGAVGSIVGQIAKLKGCKVVGIAGSDKKVKWLKQELGFDEAFNYKTVNVETALKEAAPNGVDCYFDNVGGELSSTVIRQMNLNGRVATIGSISSYNEDPRNPPKATLLQPSIVAKSLLIQGFRVWDALDRWSDAFGPLVDWIKSGQVNVTEHITEGFSDLPEALLGVLTGDNTGKAVVKI